jgi:hypothetical protein
MAGRAYIFVMLAVLATMTASCSGTTQWADAYQALGADVSARRAGGRDIDRILLATAESESEPPKGLEPGPRIHPHGTLAHLKYRTFDASGAPLDSWEVRALVPPLPNIEGHAGQETPLVEATRCSGDCGDRGRTGLVLLRSGEPGLAAEWVLRMPIGRTFDLGARPVMTQDLLGDPRRVSLVSRRDGDRYVSEPTNVQVTLQSVCAANVRVGSFARFEFDENTLPMPRGWRKYRWVQLDGCGQLHPLAVTTPAPAAPVRPAPRIPEPAGDTSHSILTVRRDPGKGYAQLTIDEAWLQREGIPRTIQLERMCQFNPATNAWQPAPATDARGSLRVMVRSPGEAGQPPRVLALLPREPGLYWVQWREGLRDTGGNAARSAREAAFKQHDALVPSGPILCNDVDIGHAPAGTVATCVPFAGRAQVRFVPKPDARCGR